MRIGKTLIATTPDELNEIIDGLNIDELVGTESSNNLILAILGSKLSVDELSIHHVLTGVVLGVELMRRRGTLGCD